MEPSPLPLPVGERGLRLGNLRKAASALPFLADGRSDAGVGGGELGAASMEVDEGLLGMA